MQHRWMGKCPDCGEWDALEEFRPAEGGAQNDAQRGAIVASVIDQAPPKATPISEVDQTLVDRIPTHINEFDRVLGQSGEESESNGSAGKVKRGIVPGSVVLVGGDPGIGKSTLLLQAANKLATHGSRVLYVTSEESAQQTRLRAERLGASCDELFVLADTNLARVVEQARQVNPAVLVVDSIQMIYKGDLSAAPGSVTQIRACCTELVYLAKASGMAVVLVGHVTKEGQIAGPRLLEHMVDTVLYFEGDRYHAHRVVRAVKNRFGTTLEVGLFEMSDKGLREVVDGGGLLAAEYHAMSGSVVCPVQQGTRCLMVELQALTATSILGSAKRKVSGIDPSRLAMLIAVLEKRGGMRLADQDVFTNTIGGMKIVEPAADLATALAIAGAHLDRQLCPITKNGGDSGKQSGICAVGEIGLGGEVRHVSGLEQRIREANRLGFTYVICPKVSMKPPVGCTLLPVERLDQALEYLT